jgi:hypothetical protein
MTCYTLEHGIGYFMLETKTGFETSFILIHKRIFYQYKWDDIPVKTQIPLNHKHG